MITPVNRLTQYYAEVAVASTLDYIGYCLKRIYPGGGVSWHYREDFEAGVVQCGLATDYQGHAHIVRFTIPIDAGGAQIKLLCSEAAEVLESMLGRFTTK